MSACFCFREAVTGTLHQCDHCKAKAQVSTMPERVQAYITPDGDVVLVQPNGDHRGVVLVPESRLLAAEARVREVEAEMQDTAQQAMRIRAERDALVPLARFAHYDLVYESPFLAALPTKEQLAAALPILAREEMP